MTRLIKMNSFNGKSRQTGTSLLEALVSVFLIFVCVTGTLFATSEAITIKQQSDVQGIVVSQLQDLFAQTPESLCTVAPSIEVPVDGEEKVFTVTVQGCNALVTMNVLVSGAQETFTVPNRLSLSVGVDDFQNEADANLKRLSTILGGQVTVGSQVAS